MRSRTYPLEKTGQPTRFPKRGTSHREDGRRVSRYAERLTQALAGKIVEHPVYWVILIGSATRGSTDEDVSHFGRMLHTAQEAEGTARNGRLCDYVILKRWKAGERGRTFEHALTSDPGNIFYWNWLANRMAELEAQELLKRVVT